MIKLKEAGSYWKMGKEYKESIWISTPDNIHRNYGLQIWTDNERKINLFYELCQNIFLNDKAASHFGTFIQGGSQDIQWDNRIHLGSREGWLYFEFWKSHIKEIQDEILKNAIEIARVVELPLEIN